VTAARSAQRSSWPHRCGASRLAHPSATTLGDPPDQLPACYRRVTGGRRVGQASAGDAGCIGRSAVIVGPWPGGLWTVSSRPVAATRSASPRKPLPARWSAPPGPSSQTRTISGYGAGAVVILHQIRDGVPWRQAAAAAFGGQGSCGNGAGMRVAPLRAYHADRPAAAAEEAIKSAEVTHAHPEGVAGGPRRRRRPPGGACRTECGSRPWCARPSRQRRPAGAFFGGEQ
jgi:hypothetical protein